MKIANSMQIKIKFKNRDRLKADQVKGKPIMKGNEIVGIIDDADNYFIYGHLYLDIFLSGVKLTNERSNNETIQKEE